jgi:hypothetical protein
MVGGEGHAEAHLLLQPYSRTARRCPAKKHVRCKMAGGETTAGDAAQPQFSGAEPLRIRKTIAPAQAAAPHQPDTRHGQARRQGVATLFVPQRRVLDATAAARGSGLQLRLEEPLDSQARHKSSLPLVHAQAVTLIARASAAATARLMAVIVTLMLMLVWMLVLMPTNPYYVCNLTLGGAASRRIHGRAATAGSWMAKTSLQRQHRT